MSNWEYIKVGAWLVMMCAIAYVGVWILHCLIR